MNPHPHSSVTLPTHAWFGFVSLVSTALVVCLLASATNVKAQEPTWRTTGSLGTARYGHTATLLANGNVLVVGGTNVTNPCCGRTGSAELYDPETGQWSATGSLSTPRGSHVAVRLANGKVLVAGGFGSSTILTTAEIYDPDTGAWSAAANLSVARADTIATLLADGRVLVAGGSGAGSAFLNSAELYDPATGAWSPAGTMNSARGSHTATLLPSGKVLVAAGGNPINSLNSAELYDPATGSWTATSNLISARTFHTATLLPNGKVLVAGGAISNHCDDLDKAELYDPATGQWSATGSLFTTRSGHTATLLANGNVLVAAGNRVCEVLNSSELYHPAAEGWSVTRSLNTARYAGHTATLLANGKVLVAGGDSGGDGTLDTAELFGSGIPQITGVSISGKKLFMQGENFDEGAKILLNDEKQKSANDEQSPATLLIGRKAGKRIGLGETVRLKVRNSDGTESAEFSYTRPAQ